VAEYRAYVVGHDGHFIRFESLICADDAEAIAKAKRLVDDHDVELWCGERFVHPTEGHDEVSAIFKPSWRGRAEGEGEITIRFRGIAFVRLFRLDLAVERMKKCPSLAIEKASPCRTATRGRSAFG